MVELSYKGVDVKLVMKKMKIVWFVCENEMS